MEMVLCLLSPSRLKPYSLRGSVVIPLCWARFLWADTPVSPYVAVPVISTVWEISLNVAVKEIPHCVSGQIRYVATATLYKK